MRDQITTGGDLFFYFLLFLRRDVGKGRGGYLISVVCSGSGSGRKLELGLLYSIF